MAGAIQVDGRLVDKPGVATAEAAVIEVVEDSQPFVSRAGSKLDGALEHFELDVHGLVCLDVGASTGGFTDCLLGRGASRVYAIDVGYGQLDYGLRNDPTSSTDFSRQGLNLSVAFVDQRGIVVAVGRCGVDMQFTEPAAEGQLLLVSYFLVPEEQYQMLHPCIM